MSKITELGPEYRNYVLRKIEELKPWYHKIDLGDGIITPGNDYDELWQCTQNVIDEIDYKNKVVLDLASWDGYWAFEAEKKGAKFVVSSDIRLTGYRNLLFAREVLDSNVIPLCNVSVQNLQERLSVVGMPEKFDIIHHFGLFYHLRDPLLSLTQARKMISNDGYLILETAYIHDMKKSYMMFSGLPGNYHFYAASDTWAPTLLCIEEVLIRSYFQPVMREKWQIYRRKGVKNIFKKNITRITIIAKPIPVSQGTQVDYNKVFGAQ